MDHGLYLDAKAKEFEKLAQKEKCMIIRGATGRKMPYGRVNTGDVLYFINNNAEGLIKAKAVVSRVFNSEKMEKEQSEALVAKNQGKLNLPGTQIKKWAGKRYLVFIEFADFVKIEEFKIDKSNFGNMNDWMLVEKIENVKI